jgi:hypothetical protein
MIVVQAEQTTHPCCDPEAGTLSHDEALANILAVFPDATVIQPCPVCGGSCVEHYILPYSEDSLQAALDEEQAERQRQAEDEEHKRVLRFPRADRRGKIYRRRAATVQALGLPPGVCDHCGDPLDGPGLIHATSKTSCRDRHRVCNECGLGFADPSGQCPRRGRHPIAKPAHPGADPNAGRTDHDSDPPSRKAS